MSDETAALLDAFDIELWLDQEGVDYKRTSGNRGPQLNVKTCPVCGNSKSKVYLNAEHGLGNCFAGDCGIKFNKASFVKAHLGLDEWPAVFDVIRKFAKEMGGYRAPKSKVVAVIEEPAAWKLPDHYVLPIKGQNLRYLEDRSITSEVARYFNLRYCDSGWYRYTSIEGEPKGQNFSGRVLIPVFNLQGEMQTFQGRDITGTAKNKYLFPARLPASGKFLFNSHNARTAKRACLGEGAFDVAAIYVAFKDDPELRDVVPIGSFGKHFSAGDEGKDQLNVLMALKASGLAELTIMWDGEPAALEDALKAADTITRMGVRVRIAFLPKGKDPNEVLPKVVREVFRRALPYSRELTVKLRLRNPYA